MKIVVKNTLTPMHVAVIHGQGRIVKELMDRGAPVDEKDTVSLDAKGKYSSDRK
jgi:ankyrin repeat protein